MATKKKAVKKKVVKKKVATKSEKFSRNEGTMGHFIIEMIKDKKTNDAILKAVVKKYPDCKTTIASVSWYRNRLRADNASIPTNRSLTTKK